MARRRVVEADPNDPLAPQLSAEENEYFATRGGDMPTEGEPVGGEAAPAPQGPTPASGAQLESEAGEQGVPSNEQRTPAERGLLNDLQGERERRQKVELELQAQREENQKHREMQARIDERLRAAAEARAAQEQAALQATRPDPEADPLGHMRWQNEQLQRRVDQQDEFNRRQYEYLQQQAQAQQVAATGYQKIAQVNNLAQQFTTQQPDYPSAYNHLISFRDRELQIMGYRDPRQRQTILQNEAQMISDAAMAEGVNPAARVYELAQLVGYQRPATTPGAYGAPPMVPPNGQMPIQPARQQGPNGSQRVAALQQGQRASRTLTNVQGAPGNAPYSLERLASMPQDEFDQLYAKDPQLVDSLYKTMD